MKNTRSIWQSLYAIPHRLAWADAGLIRTRYLEVGSDQTDNVILLHGTAGSLENFVENYEALSKHFHVYGIDMLGCGLTDKPEYDYTISDYASHVVAFMRAAGIESAHLVGVSLGSWVAARIAADYPEKTRKLVFCSPAGIVTDAEKERAFAEGVRKRRSQAAAQPTYESVLAAMKGLVLNPEQLSDELVNIRLDIYRQPEMQAAMSRLLAFSLGGQHLTREAWQNLANEILIFASVDAKNMFLDNAYALSRVCRSATLVEISGCDHWPQYEQSDRFNAETIRFLSQS